MRHLLVAAFALVLVLRAEAGDKAKDSKEPDKKPAAAREQYNALLAEYQEALKAFNKASMAAKTPQEQQKAFEEFFPKPEQFSPRFIALAEANPKDAVALDALLWVMNNRFGRPSREDAQQALDKAMTMLLRDYADSPQLGRACQGLAYNYDSASAKFLRSVMAKSPHAEVQGEASLALAQSLMQRHAVAKNIQENPTYVKQMAGALGKEVAEELAKLDLAKVQQESDELYRLVAEKHAPNMKTDALVRLCQTLSRGANKGAETVLRILLEKSAKRDVQGPACLSLAQALKHRAEALGAKDADAASKLLKESEALFERGIKEFADVKFGYYGTVGSKAKSELHDLRHLTVGKEAPDIEGEDQDGKKFKLTDYRGKVVFLDFWSQY